MLKKILTLIMFSFLTLTAYADENASIAANGSEDNVIWVKENMIHQYFFVGETQKNMVFRNATNKTMYFVLMNSRETSEGPVVVQCIQNQAGASEINKIMPGENNNPGCKTQDTVSLTYGGTNGFASGIYHIILIPK